MAKDPLILFLSDRSRARFADLVAAHRVGVLNAAWRATGDADVAEDVAQEVLLKLLDLSLDPGEVRSPRGLIVTMTVNAARSRLRSEVRRRDREQEALRRREEAGGMDVGQANELREAVSELPGELRDCVELRYFGGLSLGAVAKATGLAVRTVSQKLKDARDRLRVRLVDTAFSAPLAFLAGEQEVGLPELVPSDRYFKTTDRLAAKSRLASDRFRVRKVASGVIIGACALLIIAFGVFHENHPEDGVRPDPDEVVSATRSGGIDDGLTTLGTPGELVNGRTSGEERPAAAGDPLGAGESSTGVTIRVVGEEGNLLREGEFKLGLDGIPDFDQIEKLRAWRGLLKTYSLADTNPLEVSGLPPAAEGLALRVSATAPGRAPSVETNFTVQTGKTLVVTVVTPLPREMAVLVLNRYTKEPVVGASVVSKTELRRRKIEAGDAIGTAGPGSAITGPDGRCLLGGLGDEPHDLEVHAGGYVAASIYELPLSQEAPFLLEPIRDGAAVVVTVIDPNGEPLAGLRVKLDVNDGYIRTVLRTDAAGRCRFPSVTPGGHVVSVDTDEWFRLREERRWTDDDACELSRLFTVEPGKECEVLLGRVPCSFKFTVVVRDPRGEPKPGVEVRLGGGSDPSATTDASGRAVFDELTADTYEVHLGEWEYEEEIEIGPEARERVFEVVLGEAAIRGRASPGASIWVSGVADMFADADEDGNFEVTAVPPGIWRVEAFKKELKSAPVTVEVKGAESPEPVELEMVQSGRILIVFREPDRPVLAEAKLRLFGALGEEHPVVKSEVADYDRRSPKLLPGRYEIEITCPNRNPLRITVELEGGDTRVEVGAP